MSTIRALGRLMVAVTLMLASTAHAHHGRDFLLVQTAHLPESGSVFGIARQDYVSEDSDTFELAPALLVGVSDWLAFEVHSHIEKQSGESFKYESTAPALHVRLTQRSSPLAVGASVEYEVASDSDESDVAEGTAIVGYESSKWQCAANLRIESEVDSDESAEWGYAVGARRGFREHHAVGLELEGSFESSGSDELMLGYYFESGSALTLNLGIGTALDEGPDITLRTAIIWQFR